MWELQIKIQLGKLKLGAPLADLIDQESRVNRLRLLSINHDDILKLASLPMHYRDPFDRRIIAQALTRASALQ